MTQPSFTTHDVFNQSPPLADVDLFGIDRPLVEAVALNQGGNAHVELEAFGQRWGTAEMAERGRLANENTPKLKSFEGPRIELTAPAKAG